MVEWVQGGNRLLGSEKSESWSVGMIFTPRATPELRISADWSRIEKVDNITAPRVVTSQAEFEQFLSLYPERIVRGESSDGLPGPIIGVDGTLVNIASLQVEAVDLAVDYQVESSRIGMLDWSLEATHLINLETQNGPSTPLVQNVGVLRFGTGSLRWKTNASMNWSYQGWTLGWRTRFFDSYFYDPTHTANPSQGAASIPSQIYHDLHGGYRFASGSASVFSVLADMEVRFGVNNVFNKEPPLDIVAGGSYMYSPLGDPRLAHYFVSVRKTFGY